MQYAAEVLPTVVRAQGVALIHIMGYVASILAPFVVYLGEINAMLPLLILGLLGILGGLLSLLLPETLDQELPQTLEDGENFGRNQKFWDMPCIKRLVTYCKEEKVSIANYAFLIYRNEDETPVEAFKRSTAVTSSIHRASIRGEMYRSSLIMRSSIRSKKNAQIPE